MCESTVIGEAAVQQKVISGLGRVTVICRFLTAQCLAPQTPPTLFKDHTAVATPEYTLCIIRAALERGDGGTSHFHFSFSLEDKNDLPDLCRWL